MRILYCNKYDYPFSGTEAYLFDLIHQMDRRGHETALFSMDHGSSSAFAGRAYRLAHCNFKDPGAGFFSKLRLAAHALYSTSAQRAMRKCIADFSPDLAHIRGIYHHLSPSILWELKRRHVPCFTTSMISKLSARPTIWLLTGGPARPAGKVLSIT